MPSAYENFYIGVFIHTAGRIEGERAAARAITQAAWGIGRPPGTTPTFPAAPPASVVALTQQTPLDKALSDVYLQAGGQNLLIEFKKHAHELRDEFKKPVRERLLARLRAPGPGDADLPRIAAAAHMLGVGVTGPEDVHGLELTRYVDAARGAGYLAPAGPASRGLPPVPRHFEAFLHAFLDADVRRAIGCSNDEFARYLAALQDAADAAGGRAVSADVAGLIVRRAPNGRLGLVPFASLAELTQPVLGVEDRQRAMRRVTRAGGDGRGPDEPGPGGPGLRGSSPQGPGPGPTPAPEGGTSPQRPPPVRPTPRGGGGIAPR